MPRGIGEGEQRQHHQVFGRLHLAAKLRMTGGSSKSRRCEIWAMSKMIFDEQAQRVRGRAVQAQAVAPTAMADLCADFGMIAGVDRFAGVVQQQREIKQERPLELLKQLRVVIDRAALWPPRSRRAFPRHTSVCSSAVY